MVNYRSSSKNSSSTGTAVSVSAPAGVAIGDIVTVIVHCNGQTTIVDNNGSTPFTEDLNDYKPNTTHGHTVSVFSRRIQSGDPSTYNFTIGASGRWSVLAIAFSTPNASTIYDVAVTTANNSDGDTATVVAPTITTTTNNAIHVAVGTLDSGIASLSTYPSGYTSIDNTTNQPIAAAYLRISPAGATGTKTFTFTGDTSAYISLSFAIKSDGSSPSASVSPSPSPSSSVSPSISPSPSPSPSPSSSVSPSNSPSPSRSPSPSSSVSPSQSPSPSRSPSPSPSPSSSTSPSPSPSLDPSAVFYLKHDEIPIKVSHLYRLSFNVRSTVEQNIGVKVQNAAGSIISLNSSYGLKVTNEWKTAVFEFTALETNKYAQLRITPRTIQQSIYFDKFRLYDLTLERRQYRIMRIQGSLMPGSFLQTLTLREKTSAETA